MDLKLEPKERLLKAVVDAIDRERAYPGVVIGLVFRFLGSPRAWQLGGERVLRELGSDHQTWIVSAATELLSRTKHGERYFRCVDPEVLYSEAALALMPARDMSDVATIEEWYEDTMPIEFVERIAALNSPPMDASSEYRPPGNPNDFVKPGLGPADFAELPFEPKSKTLEAAASLARKDVRRAIEFVFRQLGSPRAWQLGGVDCLGELDRETLRSLVDGARRWRAEMDPYHRYVNCNMGLYVYEGEAWPGRDLSNPEIIEKFYFGDTIPVEFLERIAALASD